ncbi:unnamed protein product [Prorocentrum cordatum]|uniref:Uncharacterized protein n=1 Tax=Prorocentrum cordatum TaxID=2364126 RepID=A0ABN9X2A2_9DINO|nr:unnamed protein product [Polarella glacialis]
MPGGLGAAPAGSAATRRRRRLRRAAAARAAAAALPPPGLSWLRGECGGSAAARGRGGAAPGAAPPPAAATASREVLEWVLEEGVVEQELQEVFEDARGDVEVEAEDEGVPAERTPGGLLAPGLRDGVESSEVLGVGMGSRVQGLDDASVVGPGRCGGACFPGVSSTAPAQPFAANLESLQTTARVSL